MPLVGFDCEGTLTIDGFAMNRPAWAVTGDDSGRGGLLPLWFKFDQRGEDRLLPNAAGVIPYPRRTTVTRHDLRILVVGDVDAAGAPSATPKATLQNNLSAIVNAVVNPPGGTTGTRTAVLTLAAGVKTGPIHVIGFEPDQYFLADDVTILEGTLQISIPSGRLV